MRQTSWLAGLLMLLGCASEVAVDDAGPMADAGGDGGVAADAGPADAGPTDAGPAEERFIAIALGTLVDALPDAETNHNAVAGAGEVAAQGAGNVHHEVFLGTTLLGTTENQFLSTDRWTNIEGARAVYSDPDFAAAFGSLFAAPASPVLYERSDFHEWGSLDSADASDPRFFVVVQGHLAQETVDANRTMHDAVASGGEADVRAAGDVAHVVFLGSEDDRDFLAIDVWNADTNIEAIYTDPDFASAFGTLFDAPPTVGVYRSTDWHQW